MTSSSDAGSLKRGVAFLKLLATGGVRGCPLSELAEKSGVPHPSAHRILKQLIAERLVVHDAQTHRYRLGPLAFELGLAGSMLHDIRDLCEPAMAALSRDRKSTRLNSSHLVISYAVFCLKKKKTNSDAHQPDSNTGPQRPRRPSPFSPPSELY